MARLQIHQMPYRKLSATPNGSLRAAAKSRCSYTDRVAHPQLVQVAEPPYAEESVKLPAKRKRLRINHDWNGEPLAYRFKQQ